MAAVAPVFLDTSTLLPGLIEMGPAHGAPQALMSAVAAGRLKRVHTAWHCCLEFYSVATRLPPELRLTPAMALQLVEAEILGRLQVHDLPAKGRLTFVRAAAADGIAGGRIYDAHIGEVARAAGCRRIVTENRRHFTELLRHGITVVTAKELISDVLG